ncbi:MAG: PAS domain S-box protein [candidate division NC10 bacterium]
MTEAKYKNERKTKDRTIHEPQSLCREVDHTETAEIPALERAEAKIRSLNKELERRVAERTSELQSDNEALRESEGRLRLVIDNLPVLISYVDKSGRYRFNNKTYLDWFGLPPDRVLDREVPEILGDAAYEVCEPYIVEALAGKTVSYEARLAYAHGESRHVHCAHVPDFDRDGTVKGFFSIVSDITERKRTEEALRQAHDELERRVEERTAELRRANEALTKEIAERARTERALRKSEERLHRSVLDAPIPIMMHAEGGEVLMISKRWAGLSGYSHADIPTILDWTEKAYGANKERVRDRIRRLCEIEEPFEHEAYVTTAQGERRTWDFRTAPLGRLPDGRRFVISMAVDITERKRAEAALRESEARLRAFIDHSPAAISVKNRDGRFILMNPVCERLVGRCGEEVMGKTSHDLFGKIDKAYSDSMVAHDKVVLDEGRVVQSEVTLELEDGVHTLHMNKFPIRDATGTIVAIGTEAVDITARKRAEEALRESDSERATWPSSMRSSGVTWSSPWQPITPGPAPFDAGSRTIIPSRTTKRSSRRFPIVRPGAT